MTKIILIGGGSSSGKTFITNGALKEIDSNDITYISFDDYYRDISHLTIEERKKENFDHPDAFDWDLLLEQVSALKRGETIEKPIYDFEILTRSKKTELVKPKKVVIFEGIMALENSKIRKLSDLKIFVDASPERRFLRRLIRDHSERTHRPYEFIINQYFSTVKPMFDLYIKPTEVYADAIIYNEGTKESESKATNILKTLIISVLKGN
ncbi:MAG: uridine kinase [Bacilli bacterium]